MNALGLIALIVVSAMWGGHAVVGKAVEQHLTPYTLTLWRFTFTALLYAPWFGRLKAVFALPRKQILQLLLTSLCLSVIYPLFYYQSLSTLSPVESLLLINTAPLVAVLFGWIAFAEKLSKYTLVGLLISFSGVLALVAVQWGGKVNVYGVLFALIGAVAFAGYTVLSRQLFIRLPLPDVLMSTSLFGAIFIWVLAPFFTSKGGLITPMTHLTSAGWWQLAYIVVIVSTVAYALYGFGLGRVPAGIASAITFYPEALFAAVMEWLWLGIVPTLVTYISAILILGGTALMRRGEVLEARRVKQV